MSITAHLSVYIKQSEDCCLFSGLSLLRYRDKTARTVDFEPENRSNVIHARPNATRSTTLSGGHSSAVERYSIGKNVEVPQAFGKVAAIKFPAVRLYWSGNVKRY